jgi:hypothetical protein
MASQASCPSSCPFYDAGCYAEGGPQGIQTHRLNRSPLKAPAAIANAEAAAITTLTAERPLRLHIVGDCTTNSTARILGTAVRKYKRQGSRHYGTEPAAWLYTHAWRTIDRKAFGPISALASCETLSQVTTARAKGYATALVVDRFESAKAYVVGGVKLVPCPQQTKRSDNCMSCKLCWDDTRLREAGITIAFEAHGQRARKVRDTLVQITAK